jgi:hypothetical protein
MLLDISCYIFPRYEKLDSFLASDLHRRTWSSCKWFCRLSYNGVCRSAYWKDICWRSCTVSMLRRKRRSHHTSLDSTLRPTIRIRLRGYHGSKVDTLALQFSPSSSTSISVIVNIPTIRYEIWILEVDQLVERRLKGPKKSHKTLHHKLSNVTSEIVWKRQKRPALPITSRRYG